MNDGAQAPPRTPLTETVPMPDPLDATRCEVTVTAGTELTLAFDFETD